MDLADTLLRRGHTLLLALMLGLLALIGGGTLFTLQKLRSAELNKHLAISAMQARLMESFVTHSLNLVGLSLAQTVQFDTEAPPAGRLNDEVLRQQLQRTPLIRSLSLLDAQGRIYRSSEPRNIGLDPDLEPLLPGPLPGRDQLRIGVPFEGRDFYQSRRTTPGAPADPRQRSFIPVLFTSADGQRRAVAALNPDLFLNYFLASLAEEEGAVDLLRYDRRLLITSDSREGSGGLHRLPEGFDPDMQAYITLEQRHAGEAVLSSLRASRDYPLLVLVHLRRDRVLAAWSEEARDITTKTVLVMLLLLLGGLLGALLLRRANLREARARYQTRLAAKVYETSTEGVMVTDDDNQILLINPAFSAITGYTQEEVQGQNPRMLSSGHHGQPFYAQLWRTLESQGSWSGEIINRHKDGHLVQEWLRISRLPKAPGDEGIRFVAVFSDLTQRKARELQIHQLSLAVEQSPVSVLITDLDGHIEYVNTTFCHSTGYDHAEVLGKTPALLQSGLTPATTYSDLWHHLTAGKSWDGEFINRRKDGSHSVQRAQIAPLIVDGTTTHYVAVMHDITELRSLTENLRQAKERAERADRAKSAFLAAMSHELRTPLNAILGHAQQLRRDLDSHAEPLGRVDIILRSGDHLLTLINDILDLTRMESGELTIDPVDCDLARLLHALTELYGSLAKAQGLTFVNDAASDLPAILRLDARRLRQVLGTLLGNAINQTESGQVRLATHRAPALYGEHILFEVSDTRGVQSAGGATELRQGERVGLALSHDLVQLMGGELRLDPQHHGGSRFIIELPLEGVRERHSEPPIEAEVSPIALPDALRQELLELVRTGRVQPLRARLRELSTSHPELALEPLQQAAQQLDLRRVRRLLEA